MTEPQDIYSSLPNFLWTPSLEPLASRVAKRWTASNTGLWMPKELKAFVRAHEDRMEFVLRSLLFMFARPPVLRDAFTLVSDPGTTEMVRRIIHNIHFSSARDKDTWLEIISRDPEARRFSHFTGPLFTELYEALTSPDLPYVPENMLLQTSLESASDQAQIQADSFLLCDVPARDFGSEGAGDVNAIIRPLAVRGLVVFRTAKKYGHVVLPTLLPPGIMLTWNRDELEAYVPQPPGAKLEDGQYVREERLIRLYDAEMEAESRILRKGLTPEDVRERSAETRGLVAEELKREQPDVLARIREREASIEAAVQRAVRRRQKQAVASLSRGMEQLREEEKRLPGKPTAEQRQEFAQKAIKLEAKYRMAVCSGAPLPENIEGLGDFRLSKRAQKYCVGLVNHPERCTLLRRKNDGSFRYLGNAEKLPLRSWLAISKAARARSAACSRV